MIDLKSIRAAAEAATPGPWHFGTFHKLLITDADNSKHFPIAQIEGSELPWDSTEEGKRAYNNADHIATANPATVIALLDRLEAAEKDAATRLIQPMYQPLPEDRENGCKPFDPQARIQELEDELRDQRIAAAVRGMG